MMKQFWQMLSSWWFTTMVPVYGPLVSIDARETLRKRRLFSIFLLLDAILEFLLTIECFFNHALLLEMVMSMIIACLALGALWINQRGYLKSASFFYFFLLLLNIFIFMPLLASETPIFSILLWPMLLLVPVGCGLFLLIWGPLLLSLLEAAFIYWFVLYGAQSQIAHYIPDPQIQIRFLYFAIMLIFFTALLGTIYATTTRKAVIQADRAAELELAYATIEKQALTDGLTALPNHRAVMDQFARELGLAGRHDRSLSVLFFDADHFKHVNDTYGHAAGDSVLRQIGERASSALRSEDTLGRFGGEEFVVLLPETDTREACLIAERIRIAVANGPMAASEVEGGIAMTVSIGLATYPSDGALEQDLLSLADQAMYIAKRLGRNQIRTAEEARHLGANVELMMLVRHEAARQDGMTQEQLRETYISRMIYSLLFLLERRDEGLNIHAHTISDLATFIAQHMGLKPDQVSRITIAALLHDIGKIALPDRLLQNPNPLSTHEQALLREHAEVGAQILEACPFLSDLIPAVRHHHERWDGCGYPDQLAGEAIPLSARIIAVAEAYDLLQQERPLHTSRSTENALAEGAGTQFDPAVVQALLKVLLSQPSVALVS